MASFVIRTQEYRRSQKGIFKLEADTVEELMRLVDDLFKEYPKRPYDSSVGPIVKVNDGRFQTYFEHWGAD